MSKSASTLGSIQRHIIGGESARVRVDATMVDVRIRPLVTQQALLISIVTATFALVYAVNDMARLAIALVPLIVVGASSAVLSRGPHLTTARHLLLGVANLYIFLFAAHFGPMSSLQSCFFATAGNAMLLFDSRALRHLTIAAAQPVLYIVLLFTTDLVQLPLPRLPPHYLAALSPTIDCVVLAFLALTFFNFKRLTGRYELVAAVANERLAQEMALVNAQQELLSVANAASELSEALPAVEERIAALTGWQFLATVKGVPVPWPATSVTLAQVVRSAGHVVWSRVPAGVEIAVPVTCRGDVAASLHFLAQSPSLGASPGTSPEPELLRALEAVGRQLGHVEERARAQSEIAANNMRLAAASKMATLGEVAGGIAHEINNPLAVIQGYVARIRKQSGWSDAEARDKTNASLDAITETIHRINRIVTGLRAFARDATGDPFEAAPASRLVQDALALTGERFRTRGVIFEVGPLEQDIVLEACRPTQVTQVLVNLLANAFDAVQDAACPRVRIQIDIESGEACAFTVFDNGPGIQEQHREKVMQPFFTTKPVGRGTGLGLSISKGIVDDHGGTLEYDRIMHRGEATTRFKVRLPIGAPKDEAPED